MGMGPDCFEGHFAGRQKKAVPQENRNLKQYPRQTTRPAAGPAERSDKPDIPTAGAALRTGNATPTNNARDDTGKGKFRPSKRDAFVPETAPPSVALTEARSWRGASVRHLALRSERCCEPTQEAGEAILPALVKCPTALTPA